MAEPVLQVTMQEKRIKSYFKRQVPLIIRQSASEPDGFLAYFAGNEIEVKDEAILGLLAVSTLMSENLRAIFPTPVEALASLSGSSRSEICREFRRQLKTCLKQVGMA